MKHLSVGGNILKVSISVIGALMLVGWLIAPAAWPKPLSYLLTIALPYVPDLLKMLKVEFSAPLVVAYEVFLIIAMILGIDLDWYSQVFITANNDSYYDKIVHFSSGILVALVGQEILALHLRQAHSRPPARWFHALFLLGVVALVTVGWECFEFLYDEICGGHMQELVKAGVADTMWDMIASLGGGGLCILAIVR